VKPRTIWESVTVQVAYEDLSAWQMAASLSKLPLPVYVVRATNLATDMISVNKGSFPTRSRADETHEDDDKATATRAG
jgi:hypothetical protein